MRFFSGQTPGRRGRQVDNVACLREIGVPLDGALPKVNGSVMPSDDSSQPDGGQTADNDVGKSTDLADAPPMTLRMMGRFFAVPFVIIGTIVGGAVMVVLLFGGPASPQRRSIDQLLQVLEAGSGEKSLGVLLPREKELWQAALELSVRLEKKDREKDLTGERLTELAERLGAMVRTGLGDVDRLATVGTERVKHGQVRDTRLAFLIQALGWTERPQAVETLLAVLETNNASLVVAALQSLGRLYELPAAAAAVPRVRQTMVTLAEPEVRLVAATVLSVLAQPGDEQTIEALRRIRLTDEGEVGWSASLALARLGSVAGKSTLMDLLDRSFLESGELYQIRDDLGAIHRYQLPQRRVEELLVATIDAVSMLDDDELWEMIGALARDSSPRVRSRAAEALDSRKSAEAGTLEE